MNDMGQNPEGGGDGGAEPEIVIIGVSGEVYYLYKGEDHLDQVLLVNGDFPKPILCVNFETKFDVLRTLGEGFSLSKCWTVHPDIVQRLKDSECIIETDA